MTHHSSHLSLSVSQCELRLLTRAAALRRQTLHDFVLEAALREAKRLEGPPDTAVGQIGVARRLRGLADPGMDTDSIMKLTRGS